MSKHSTRRPRQYPQGPRREMTDEWKLQVEAAMRSKDPPVSRADLARELGVTRGLVTKLLRPISQGGQQVSALVPAICKLLDVPMPNEPTPEADDRRRRLGEVIGHLSDEQIDVAIRFLEAMTKT